MHAIDFEYDGRRLSDYGFIICSFDPSGGAEFVQSGAKINFTTVSKRRGERFSLIGADYTETVSATFDICKNPDDFDDNMMITDEEYLKLTRWLCRKEFLKLFFIDDELDIERRYYNGTFSAEKILVRQLPFGLRLTLTTDKGYAHGERQRFYYVFDGTGRDYSYLYDYSAQVRTFIPDIKITCLEAGNLTVGNELTGTEMVFLNCSANEEITINGDTLYITTSDSNHNIWDDFNYVFLKIGNTFGERNNKLAANLNCAVEITYSPVIMDSP